jgi:cation diffusion facilitator family transporter
VSTEGGTKAIFAALAANVGIAVTKFAAFLVSGSTAMLAESIHSLADSANQVLLLIGGRRSQQVATPEHPFGFGRLRYLYSFLVAVVLFVVGGLFSVYEGVHKLQHPEGIDNPVVPFVVLVVAIGLESFSLRTAMHEARPLLRGDSWWQFIRHAKSPELPVVLLEDTAALLGLVLALGGVTLAVATDNGRWDGLGSVAIGVLLLVVAVILGTETQSMLVGEGARPGMVEDIRHALEDDPSVARVIHLRTMHIAPDEVLVAAKIAIRHTDTATDIVRAIDAAEARVRAVAPIATLIYLEPDLDRGTVVP